MKTRSDSLWAKLKPAQREELLHALVVENVSYSDAVEKVESWGYRTSASALCSLLQTHGAVWRIDRAKQTAQVTEKALPKNYTDLKKRGLAQREFELSFAELSVKELVALKRLELAEAALSIDKRKLEMTERKLKDAEEALTKAKERGGLDEDTIKEMEKALKML